MRALGSCRMIFKRDWGRGDNATSEAAMKLRQDQNRVCVSRPFFRRQHEAGLRKPLEEKLTLVRKAGTVQKERGCPMVLQLCYCLGDTLSMWPWPHPIRNFFF